MCQHTGKRLSKRKWGNGITDKKKEVTWQPTQELENSNQKRAEREEKLALQRNSTSVTNDRASAA